MQEKFLSTQNSSLTLYPERGGIITSLKFGKGEVLYQDMLQETLHDETKSVRGGIPILFPQAGPITQKEAKPIGYSLPQHGVVRQRPWETISQSGNTLELQYLQNENTSEFPYQFSLKNFISLCENRLRLDFTLKNLDSQLFPHSHGYHPYFAIPEGDKDAIIWDDRYSEEIIQTREIWKNDGTISLYTQNGYFDVEIPGVGKLRLCFSPEIKKIWIWSLTSKNFVCIEPVVGDEGNLIHEPEIITPNEERKFFFEIQKI